LLPIRVTGQSMQPNYRDGSINFINTLSYLRNKPQRGEVVAILTTQGEVLLKRIVGLPGEQISFWQGHVYVNGKLLDEPYTFSRILASHRGTRLGPDQYFVAGDNRPITAMVVIKSDQILGRVIY
ncbi:MAG: signal peptidase I, partial [Opitutaceae bacterium]|nr:signal peptidase I [Verrucomicrobiales bacterium]